MKKVRVLFVVSVLTMLVFTACDRTPTEDTPTNVPSVTGMVSMTPKVEESDITSNRELYIDVVIEVLKNDLFLARDCYDSCHYLMVPLYFAFQEKDVRMINAFQTLFDRFCNMSQDQKDEFNSLSGLAKNHFYYLASEYMSLCVKYGYEYDEVLFYNVLGYITEYYDNWHGNWAAYKQYNDFGALMEGLLEGSGYESDNSLNNIITDNENFPLAILCDLRYIANTKEYDVGCYREYLESGYKYAKEMMQSKVVWKEYGGWEFQPGEWRDHSDFSYAGYYNCEDVQDGIYKRVDGIVEDSSHFIRMACFLNSFERCENDEMFRKLKNGLATQFKFKVLVNPSSECVYFRTTNYMNGYNGLFNYSNEVGYEEYGLSKTFLVGWWALLGDETIQEAYTYTNEMLSKTSSIPVEYGDVKTTREQNPIFMSKEYFEALCYFASKLHVDNVDAYIENSPTFEGTY